MNNVLNDVLESMLCYHAMRTSSIVCRNQNLQPCQSRRSRVKSFFCRNRGCRDRATFWVKLKQTVLRLCCYLRQRHCYWSYEGKRFSSFLSVEHSELRDLVEQDGGQSDELVLVWRA